MSSKDKLYKNISKSVKVTCRVCKETIKSQNYERHLRRCHPEEDSKILSTYGQRKFSFGNIAQKEAAGGEPSADVNANVTLSVEEDVNENITNKSDLGREEAGWQNTIFSPPATRSETGQGGSVTSLPLSSQEGAKGNVSVEVLGRGIKRPREEEDITEVVDLSEIEEKVDKVLDRLELKLIHQNIERSPEDRVKFKLDFIISNIKLTNTVTELQKAVKEVKKMSDERVEVSSNLLDEVKHVLVACRSVSEIENKVPEFRFDEKSEKVICLVCKQVFKYDVSLEQGRKQSASLIHLKDNLKNHLFNSASHQAALDKSEVKDKIEKKEESRNEKCGMTLGRTAYHILRNGHPCSNFTQLLSMQHSNGCDIGDINHSTALVNNLAKSFNKVISGRVKVHLSSRLPQTGCLPPCKVVEDGATYRHDTRHLIGLTTIFPGDQPLIQSVFCGAPKGVRSDGASTAKSMATTISQYMDPQQYVGTSTDGANFLAGVGELLDQLLGQEGHHDWDGVHAAATIDAGLRNPKKAWAELFAWLNEITNIISKANRFHNWGMEWDRFFRTCQAMVEEGYDLKCKVPKFFSATRFANYAVKIYTRFR